MNWQKLARALRSQLWGLVEWVVRDMPDPLGGRARYWYWKRRLHSLGKHTRFGAGIRIYNPEWVSIGERTWIDDCTIILAGPAGDGRYIARKPNPHFAFREGEVVIGNCVHVAPFVLLQGHGGLFMGNGLGIASGTKIYTLSHHYRDLTGRGPSDTIWKFTPMAPGDEQALICSPTVLHDNTAVGMNSVILPGSTIGEGSWLGAMSLLRGELPCNVIASGNPAQVVKDRFQ